MPAKAPAVGDILAARLKALGQRVRAERGQQKLSATVVAEAAGMSRVTLHRIERGEPSVTMGAYLSAIDALGLQINLSNPQAARQGPQGPKNPAAPAAPPALPALQGAQTQHGAQLLAPVRLADYPQLKRLAWQLHGVDTLSPAEALSLYERNWRHIAPASLGPTEQALVQNLVDQLGGGRLLV